jgi:fumarylacetoacetate (FAA) hydrolase
MFSPREANLRRGWPGRIEGDRVVQLAAQTLQSFFTGGGHAREHAEYRLADVVLRPPVLRPPSVRVFDAPGRFTFSNPAAIYGPEDEVPYPRGTERLEYRPALAAVIGAEGQIGGFTVMNDWTAPDLESPKDRDFATSIGPIVVTPDELDPGELTVAARVNGEERRRGHLAELRIWGELVAHAGRNTVLLPGDILAYGGDGDDERSLRPGDVVELEVQDIGVLRNRVEPASAP